MKNSIVAFILTKVRPKKLLETIKGVSEQKATKILVEGQFATSDSRISYLN
jgi:hypothetical protein